MKQLKHPKANIAKDTSSGPYLCAGVGCPLGSCTNESSNVGQRRKDVVKYRCPVAQCMARYCSVACCKSHKALVHSVINAVDGESQASAAATIDAGSNPTTNIQREESVTPAGATLVVDGMAILNEVQKHRLVHDADILHMLGSKRLRQQISLVDQGNEQGGSDSATDSHSDRRTKMLQMLRNSDAEFNGFIEKLLDTVKRQR